MSCIYKVLIAFGIFSLMLHTTRGEKTRGSDQWDIPVIKVVDELGNPLPNSEAAMVLRVRPQATFKFKSANDEGVIQFTQEDYVLAQFEKDLPKGDYDVLVLAAGKIPVTVQWTLPTSSPLVVHASDGTPVKITLVGHDEKPVPVDMNLQIYPHPFGTAAWARVVNLDARAKSPTVLDNAEFELEVEETTEPYRLLVHNDNYLRSFETSFSTTVAVQEKHVKVQLPKPGKAILNLSMPYGNARAKQMDFSCIISPNLTAGDLRYLYMTMDVPVRRNITGGMMAEAGFLAPGEYNMSISDRSSRASNRDRLPFRKHKLLTVKTGESTSVTVPYKLFDPKSLQGKGEVKISVKHVDGSPAARLPIVLEHLAREFGYTYRITTGALTDLGTTIIKGLASGTDSPEFILRNGKDFSHIATFSLDSDEPINSFEFKLAPGSGDPAPNVTLIDIATGDQIDLSDFLGKIVFLDFWATWCIPCRMSMAHNQQILTRNETEWDGKVIIIGASIDDRIETVTDMVTEQEWDKVHHLWCGEKSQPSSPASIFGVTSVPTGLLIDQQGKIVWRGNPDGFNLEDEVNQLMN